MITKVTKQSAVKEQIIETASRLFFDQGYNLTGINQIIAEAGVAKASLYQYFASKDDLCVEYLQRRHSRWFEALEIYIKDVTDPKEKVLSIFDYKANNIKKGGYRGCTFLKIISEVPQGNSKIRTQVIRQKTHLRAFFAETVAVIPGIPKKKANELADEIMVLSEGATVMCQVFKDQWPMEAAKKGAAELLARYGAR